MTAPATAPRPELSLVIPAYNEQARLPAALAALAAFFAARPDAAELVLVDDGSRDGTAAQLAAAAARLPETVQVRVQRHATNQGKGAAVRTGCLLASGRFIIFADADMAVPLDEVDRLLAALRDGWDVAIGSRIQPDGRDMRASQPPLRRLAGKAFTRVRQIIAVPEIVDTQCPMKGFRREVAHDLFSRVRLTGWAFDAEVLFLARRSGYRVRELPVVWRHMEGSKLRPSIKLALRSLTDLVKMRLIHWRD